MLFHRYPAAGILMLAALHSPLATAAPSAKTADAEAPRAPVPADSAYASFSIPCEKYQLKNGLTVLLHQDASLPNVAVNLWYHVGPVNEPAQRSGFAHLFEHLMFEGSKYAGREFDVLLESAGGTNMNGTTSWDRTNYFETVPSEHLELALWLESDRMGFMIDGVTQERLDVQREVVKNERRQSLENQPDGPSYLATMDALFPAGHPYHGAIIGSMEDLSRASLADVKQFYESYYAPANATLALAGHFELATAKQWIEKYFGSLPARNVAKAVPTPVAPPLMPAHLEVSEPVELPRLTWAFRVPGAYSETDTALQLAARVLAEGKASRLEKALVKTGLANEVSAEVDSNRLASAFLLQVRLAEGASLQKVQEILTRELATLSEHGPSEGELRRARATFKLGLASDLQALNGPSGETGRAGVLQRLNYYLGDPSLLPRVVKSYDAVSPELVKQSVKQQLSAEHRIEIVTLPHPSTPLASPPKASNASSPAPEPASSPATSNQGATP